MACQSKFASADKFERQQQEVRFRLFRKNHDNPRPRGVPTCDVAAHQAKMKPKKRNTFVTVHVQKPVLLAKDTKQIFADSGQQVTARCREHQGAKKLLSKAPLDCDELP